jgi:hypothetical protein
VTSAYQIVAKDAPVVLVLQAQDAGLRIPDRLERIDALTLVHEADVEQDQERQQEKNEQPDIRHADDEALAGHGEGR